MRKMVPSELKGIRIEQTIVAVDKTGWESDVVDGVTYFVKTVDVTNLDIHNSDIVIVLPWDAGNDAQTLTMQAIKDGLVMSLDTTNNTIYCESLVNPSTYQNEATTIEIQLTIFRQSSL